MKAKDIAEKFAGQNFQARSSILNHGTPFDIKILGYKSTEEYVLCEVVIFSSYTGKTFKTANSWVWTVDQSNYLDKPAMRIKPSAILLPRADANIPNVPNSPNKVIPEWPAKCPDCKSPAFISALLIDCSNPKCHHKFKTSSASDLFLPVEMRPTGWQNKTQNRIGCDEDGFIICPKCGNKPAMVLWNSLGRELNALCKNKHVWKHLVQDQDKYITSTNKIRTFDKQSRKFK